MLRLSRKSGKAERCGIAAPCGLEHQRGESVNKLFRIFSLCTYIPILAFSVFTASAQNATGTITGSVRDSSGAAVADADILIEESETGIIHRTKTNDSGSYTITLLPVGVYTASAEKTGFKIAKQQNIPLNITDVARADFKLDIGPQSDTVTVSASNVLLNTENAEVATTVSERQITELPSQGRNFQDLLLLDATSYATQGNTEAGFRAASTMGDGTSIAGVGGARSASSGFLIDGLNNRDMAFGAAILLPSIEVIQQFKIQTKTYSAEYGGAANQIQIHYKSGTNAFHGSAFEFLRNDYLNATPYGQTTVPRSNYNQYGYALGGPVIIPKIFNGRGGTFFFANYEAIKNKKSTTLQHLFVPTDAQWAGQFSKTIKDPLTGLPFPGNQVPASRVSQFAKGYQNFVLRPNSTLPTGNYVGSAPSPTIGDQQNYRIDQNIGTKNSFFVRYSTYANSATTGGLNGTGLSGQTIAVANNHAYQASYTRVFSPNLVNQVTFGYVFADFSLTAPTISAGDLATFGIQGGFTTQPTPEIPGVSLTGSGLTGWGTGSNFPTLDTTKYYNGADTLTLVHGNHTLNMGFSILNWSHVNGKGANLGVWAFNGQYSGDTFADLLLGNPSTININVPSPLAPTAADAVFTYPQYTWATYVQDGWKVSRRLTVDAGLRYEFFLPVREAQDRFDWFNFDAPGGGLCTANQVAANAVGQNGLLKYCGHSQNGSPKLSFAPRLGIAYLPFEGSEKTVIRAGYGLFYDFTDDGSDAVNASSNYPFLGQQAFLGTPVTNVLSTSMPLLPITTLRPIQLSDLSRAYLAPSVYKRPYTQNWTFAVEHSPFKDTTIAVGFQGSTGTHYPTRYSLNQPLPYDPAHPTPISARRPYPNFGEVYPEAFALSSNYNAATVSARHDSRSLVLTAAYAFSKSLDIRSGTFTASSGGAGQVSNARNFSQDYGQSDFDVKHRAVFSFVYQLPFGRGQQFLQHVNRSVDILLGGWQANGVVTLQGGFPFSINAADTGGLIDGPFLRADQIGNPYPAGFQKTPQHWFSPAAFAQPAPGIPGNSGRNIIRGPGSEILNLSVIKNVQMIDRVRLQMRLEAFNALNHANYGVPGHSTATPSSLGIITGALPSRVLQIGGKIVF
jgi:hypothetical protein